MTDQITVRTGTPEDIDAMMELAAAACQDNGLIDPSVPKMLTEIWAGLTHQRGIVGIIGKPGEKIEAAILLRIDQLWYSDKTSLVERAIFVAPEFRSAKGGRARLLCEFAKKVADTLELALVIGVISEHRAAGKVRLYERQFGQPSGAYWVYRGKSEPEKETLQ